MPTLSVVIPAYNEEGGIADIVHRVLAVRPDLAKAGVDKLELLVVDDGSRDRTAEIAKQIEGVRVLCHSHNRGYGGALKTGFAEARGELIGFLDADGTYPPEYFPQVCRAALDGADLVIGSRMAGAKSQMPPMRRLGNFFFASLLSLLSHQSVTDSASGMRVFKRQILENIYPLPDGLNLTPVMSTRAVHEGMKVVEIPIPYSERVGRSKLSVVRDGTVFLQSMVWTVLTYNPVRILGMLGLAGVALGLIAAVALAAARLSGVTSLRPWEVTGLFAAVVAAVIGTSLFALGVVFNYLVSLFYKRPIRQGLFGRPIFKEPLDRHFWWMGVLSALIGLGLGVSASVLSLTGWEMARLWLYLLGSAMFILVGLQLVIYWILVRVLEELSQRELMAQRDRLPGECKDKGMAIDTDGRVGQNLGARPLPHAKMKDFANADEIVRQGLLGAPRSKDAVDILLVNPPTPDGALWIRTQHRVGRRTRENMVWPQVSLAQMAALLHPAYTLKIIDANAERMSWKAFEKLLDQYQPRYYLTQVTAPTLQNDMYGCFLAKTRGAKTIAFGTHVTPMPRQTLIPYPALDYVLIGEPDLTIRDLLDHLENKFDQRPPQIQTLFAKHDSTYKPSLLPNGQADMSGIKGLAWRRGEEIVLNAPRQFIQDLNDLPLPLHALLPLDKYRMPMMNPFTFILTGRGCPAGCIYCIKNVSYQHVVRLRTPENIMEELWVLKKLGISNINMYSDLFTVSREQVMALCHMMIDQKINMRWTCNSRVDYVDEEMLALMGQAGCFFMAWGIESGSEEVLKHAHKGASPAKAEQALRWAKKAGIMNWGYFIIGLPTETEETIRQTIDFAKRLPLDIALFHVAAPYPGTPFFFEVVENGWFRPGTRWEQVDMDRGTVLDYPGLPAERLLYWQKRAFREWAFRPGPAFTYLKILLSEPSTFASALSVGLQRLSWQAGE